GGRPGGQGRAIRGAPAQMRSAHRPIRGEGPDRRTADRPPRRAPGGSAGAGVRAPRGGGQARRHARRRRRRHRGPAPGRSAEQGPLGRKRPTAEILAEVPVIFVAWDALVVGMRGGELEPLLELPLVERRRRLEALGLPLAEDGGPFALSHLVTIDSAEALEAEFEAARARRNEGLMVKDPQRRYTPGRRGLGRLKTTKALATTHCAC